MRRTLFALVTVAIVVCLTVSVAVSATRITNVAFTAVGVTGSGIGNPAAGADSVSVAETTATKGGTAQGLCAGDCVGLYLHADGRLVGLSSTDATVVVEATGVPVVSCVNQGGNEAPGQNPPKVSTRGGQQIGITQITKNGSAAIDVTTNLPEPNRPASELGCPNDTWTASIVGIRFTQATVSVYQNGALTLTQSSVF